MTRDEALALVGGMLQAAGRGDLPLLKSFYAEDAIAISPVFGDVHGREQIGATWGTLIQTFADLKLDISNILVESDRIAVLSTVTSTDRSGWFGLPATGESIAYRLVLLLTIVDGKIARDERIYDSTGVLERLEKARLDKELRTAADVQRTLLSRMVHENRFSMSVGDSIPCRAIGGDFFEFVDLPSGDVGIAMGDVAGKGPAAALLAALLQGMFGVEASAGGGPAATLLRMNRRLASRHLGSRFATMTYGVLSADGRFAYSNAGHNPPVLLGDDGIRRLETGGPILGAFPDAAFEEETLMLRNDETLVMFTDGVTEARNAADEEFGEERLLACLQSGPALTPGMLLRRVFDHVRTFSLNADQSDDMTVTVTRRR